MSGDDQTIRGYAYRLWEHAGHPPGDGREFWLRAESTLRYLRAVADLPLPSAAQTAAFAEYVRGAHSWYKRGLTPDCRLVAYLDPDAGMVVGTTPEGESVRPILTADECYHYSDMPTEEYRRRFGCWSYGMADRNAAGGPTVRTAGGPRIPVPREFGWEVGCPSDFLLGFPAAIPVAFEMGRRRLAAARGEYLSSYIPTNTPAVPAAPAPPALHPGWPGPGPDDGPDPGACWGTPGLVEERVQPPAPAGPPGAWGPEPDMGGRPGDWFYVEPAPPRMTEAEWLASGGGGGAYRDAMLCFLGPGASARKLRLFALRCWAAQWGGNHSPGWAEAGERYANGLLSGAELEAVLKYGPRVEDWGADALTAARRVSEKAYLDGHGTVEEQCEFLRDVFGNPFRPVAVDSTWRTSAVVGLARGIYDDRAFGRLPVLADALEDAGCTDVDVLGHCRGGGEHARGCWVVDALLGLG